MKLTRNGIRSSFWSDRSSCLYWDNWKPQIWPIDDEDKEKKRRFCYFLFLNDFVYYSAYSQDQHPLLLMLVLIELGVDFHLIDRCTMSMKEWDHKDFLWFSLFQSLRHEDRSMLKKRKSISINRSICLMISHLYLEQSPMDRWATFVRFSKNLLKEKEKKKINVSKDNSTANDNASKWWWLFSRFLPLCLRYSLFSLLNERGKASLAFSTRLVLFLSFFFFQDD